MKNESSIHFIPQKFTVEIINSGQHLLVQCLYGKIIKQLERNNLFTSMQVSNLSYENFSMFQLLHSLLHAAKGSNNFYSQISLHKIPGGFQYLLFKSCMKFKHYQKMTYPLTLLKYAHFQNVLQEHCFLKLNIMNKLISKIKFVRNFQIHTYRKENKTELL